MAEMKPLRERIEKLIYCVGDRETALTELNKTIAEIKKEQKSKCICYLMRNGVRAWCSSCKLYNKVLKALSSEEGLFNKTPENSNKKSLISKKLNKSNRRAG